MGAVFRSKGQFEEGLLACRARCEARSATYVGNRIAGLCCLGLRRYDEAIGYFEFAAAAMESDFTAVIVHFAVLQGQGRPGAHASAAAQGAMDRIEKLVVADPGHSRAIGMGVAMLATLGEKERAREWATRARLVDPEAVNLQYNLACAMSSLGEIDLTLETLDGIAPRLSPGMVSWLEADTDLDPIRGEPRFSAMMKQVKARFAHS